MSAVRQPLVPRFLYGRPGITLLGKETDLAYFAKP